MKRTFLIVAGLAAVGAGLYFGARALAQQPVNQPVQSRIAVVNLHLVLKGYQKTKVYDAEVENIVGPLRKQGEELKKKMTEWKTTMEDPKTSEEHKEQYAKAIRHNKNQLDELEADAAKKVTKKREEQLVQLYREIEDAVTRYSASQGFTMVLQYTEPEEKEKYAPPNIQRKLAGSSQTGCTVPLYVNPGLDITAAVIQNLNAQYPQSPTPNVTPTPR